MDVGVQAPSCSVFTSTKWGAMGSEIENLPLQPIFNIQFLEHVHDVGVCTEEDVKPSLDPISVLVLPG